MHWCDMWWGGGWFMMIFWTVLLIVIVIWIVRTFQNRNGSASTDLKSETALSILKNRYARGEITKEEYVKMKKDLQE